MGDVTDKYTRDIPKSPKACKKLTPVVDKIIKEDKTAKQRVDQQLVAWEDTKRELEAITKAKEDTERWGRYKRTHNHYRLKGNRS